MKRTGLILAALAVATLAAPAGSDAQPVGRAIINCGGYWTPRADGGLDAVVEHTTNGVTWDIRTTLPAPRAHVRETMWRGLGGPVTYSMFVKPAQLIYAHETTNGITWCNLPRR